jgi:hypothetical protein
MGDECSMGGGAAEAGGASRRCRCGETRCRRAGWVTAAWTRAGRHRRRNRTDGNRAAGPAAHLARRCPQQSRGVGGRRRGWLPWTTGGCAAGPGSRWKSPKPPVRSTVRARPPDVGVVPEDVHVGRPPRCGFPRARRRPAMPIHCATTYGGGLGQARRPAAVAGLPMRRCMPADVPPRSAPRRPVMDRLMPAASMTPPKTSCDPENPLHGAGNLFPGIRQSSVEKRYFRKTSGFATDGGNVACRSGRFRERPHPGLRHPPPAAGRR